LAHWHKDRNPIRADCPRVVPDRAANIRSYRPQSPDDRRSRGFIRSHLASSSFFVALSG
jgi:hypothetical protein